MSKPYKDKIQNNSTLFLCLCIYNSNVGFSLKLLPLLQGNHSHRAGTLPAVFLKNCVCPQFKPLLWTNCSCKLIWLSMKLNVNQRSNVFFVRKRWNVDIFLFEQARQLFPHNDIHHAYITVPNLILCSHFTKVYFFAKSFCKSAVTWLMSHFGAGFIQSEQYINSEPHTHISATGICTGT